MPIRPTGVTIALLLACWLSALAGVAILLSHGIELRGGGLEIRAHHPWVAFAVAAACAAVLWRRGRPAVSQALARVWDADRWPRRAAIASAVCAAAFGIAWGTNVAGGSDSYCYLRSAELLAHGAVRDPQPLAARAPWPDAINTLSPSGYVPAEDQRSAAPICPAGFPFLLAAAERLGGRPAMFAVVPLLGALAVWMTFGMGRRLAGHIAGAIAAILVASSPTFLYQVTQPMSDVPAMSAWSVALLLAMRASSTWRLAAAGAATAAALLIRPNLFPLALVPTALVLANAHRDNRGVRIATFAAALMPSIAVTLWLNRLMFGHPLRSGYGRFSDLFSVAQVMPNLARYPAWLLETQTPVVLLAFLAPWLVAASERSRARWLLGFVVLCITCYIPYKVFDAWWFLRFLLPAFPVMLALTASAAVVLVGRLERPMRVMLLAAATGLLIVFQLVTSADRAVFRLKDLEWRYRAAGEYVATHLPAKAVLISDVESGSVRFYSGRSSIVWSALDAQWLDRAIEFLNKEGYRPYLLLERMEEAEFTKRFASSPAGQLDWPPIAQIGDDVRLFDPADRTRYLAGARIDTDVVNGPTK